MVPSAPRSDPPTQSSTRLDDSLEAASLPGSEFDGDAGNEDDDALLDGYLPL